MLNQQINQRQVLSVLDKKIAKKWKLLQYTDGTQRNSELQYIIDGLSSYITERPEFETHLFNNKEIVKPANYQTELLVRILDRVVRRIYKVSQSDRSLQICCVKKSLAEKGEYQLLRVDIKDFYETIPFDSMISKINEDMILEPKLLNFLTSISKELIKIGVTGLPRGLSLSSTFSELYLKDFDREIRSMDCVFLYTRYIDDICIGYIKSEYLNLKKSLKKELIALKLDINRGSDKYYKNDFKNCNFYYLGYNFKVDGKSKKNIVNLSISEAKLKKIKQKIISCFIQYKKEDDFQLLKQRLFYLASNKDIKKTKNGNLRAGINYNYKYVTDEFMCLRCLDALFYSQIQSNRYNFTNDEKDQLKHISFYSFARKNVTGKFSNKKSIKIAKAWS